MITTLDNSLFYLINRNWSNKFFNIFMPALTELGNWGILFIVALVLLFFRKREIRIFGILLILGLITSYFGVNVLKDWISRPRPAQVLQNINVLISVGGFSFPSSHATNAFLVATLLSSYTKSSYFLYLIATAVAFSRIYSGVHFPSDCLAGALIGIVLGYAIVKMYEFGWPKLKALGGKR